MKKLSVKEIADLKKKHGELYQITVDDKECILRKPTRQDLSYLSVVKDPIKMSEAALNTLWVAGDEEIKINDDLFLAAVGKMDEIMKVKEAEVKKL